MTPDEAFKIIDKIIAQLKFSRVEHETVNKALETLRLLFIVKNIEKPE